MKLGLLITPGRHVAPLARAAEEAGFESLWFVDSPAVFGDPFAAMAVAASVTDRIGLATGVINPMSRPAALAASSLCTVEALAPGRVLAGVGVGYSGVFVLGLRRAKIADLARYAEDLRVLTAGGEVVGGGGVRQRLAGDAPDSLRLGTGIPIVVAASNRKGLEAAGGCADEVLLGGIVDEGIIRRARELVGAVPGPVGRSPGDRFSITPSALLSRTKLSGEEVRAAVGPKCLSPARNFSRWAAEVYGPDSQVATETQAVVDAYALAEAKPQGSEDTDHLEKFKGYFSALEPWQEALVTDGIITMTAIVGTADEWLEKIERLEAAGIYRIILSPIPAFAEQTIRDCGELVIPRM